MTMEQFGEKFKGHVPRLQGTGQEFAVLVPLLEREGELCLLFEVRARSLRSQPGEVCFPGGKIEPGESKADCALRETWEELGIPAQSIRVIAELDFLCHQAGFLLYPVLAQVEESALCALRPNPDEVEEVFLVPFSFFQGAEPETYTYDLNPDVGEDFPYERIGFPNGYPWRGSKVDVPIYLWEGRAVWGLTARLVRWLVQFMSDESE